MKRLAMLVLVSLLVLLLSAGAVAAPSAKPKPVENNNVRLVVFLHHSASVSPEGWGTEDNPTYKTHADAKWLALAIPWYSHTTLTGDDLGLVQEAFGTWDEATSADLFAYEGGTTAVPGTRDGTNSVGIRSYDGPGGVIGGTWVWWDMANKAILEFDMFFDIDDLAAFPIQNTATHEVGHTLFLDDLRMPYTSALTMHGWTWPGDTGKQTLGYGDKLGLWHLYGD